MATEPCRNCKAIHPPALKEGPEWKAKLAEMREALPQRPDGFAVADALTQERRLAAEDRDALARCRALLAAWLQVSPFEPAGVETLVAQTRKELGR